MSFSTDVKNEIVSSVTGGNNEFACFYGMLLFCRHFSYERIVFRTEHKITADLFRNFSDTLIGKNSAETVILPRKNGGELYQLVIPDAVNREEIMKKYNAVSSVQRISDSIINEENVSPFLAGAFLSCGSMTEPMKEYHLEFAVSSSELAYDLAELLNGVGVKAKTAERKNDYVIYMKESESIEDTLTMMGAPGCSIELMNIKILKDIRNKTNRITNCDNANIERTLKASMRQIEDIEYIEKTKGLDYLPQELRNTAEVRLDNPEISLKDLGELLEKPVGRSGVNHRLSKISEIAEQLREENKRL